MKQPLPPAVKGVLQAKVRNALRREFATFFKAMLTPEKDWPAIPDEEFIDALADAVLAVGKDSGRVVAMLQTLVYEVQERINQELTLPTKKG